MFVAGRRALLAAALALAILAGYSKQSGGTSGGTAVTSGDLAFCYQETNRYRSLLGLPAVTSDPTVEAYALRAAQSDHSTGQAHGYTNGVNRPSGNYAENEAVRWRHTASIRAIVARVLAAFWREGPGGGHYENLRGPWGRVGCGVVVSDGAVTVVQHFRP
jgi:uncharacterized protein YkwD